MSKSDFPIFHHQSELVYLDSAATALKPQLVLDAVEAALVTAGPVGRGLYPLSTQATQEYEAARTQIAQFFGATANQLVLTSSATAASNLLIQSLTDSLQPGDEIIISDLEHHSTILPWQRLAAQKQLILHFLPLTETGEIDLAELPELLNVRTQIINLSHVSNVTGATLDIPLLKKILAEQGSGARIILDGCQAAPHLSLNLPALGVDFYIAAGHKLYGPNGVGILWGREAALAALPSSLPGGGSIQGLSLTQTIWSPSPHHLEAGSPNLEAVCGLAVALSYLQSQPYQAHTETQANNLIDALTPVPGLRFLGAPNPASGIVSFNLKHLHPHDVADLLGQNQICVRAGHHCASRAHAALGEQASLRASVGLYTTVEDAEKLADALTTIAERFHV